MWNYFWASSGICINSNGPEINEAENVSESKGPYTGDMQAQAGICPRCKDDHEGDDCVEYARSQGFIAGRHSRDGLRRALDTISLWPFDIMGDCIADARHIARKALEDDGEGK